MPGFSKGFIFRPIQWEGLMCFIQAQYRIKGGIQGLSLENTMLFVGVIWFILLFRSVETEQGSRETQREGCCFIAKAKRTVNMFTYDNDFKTHPCKMDLFLLDLVFHVVCLTLPQTLTTYKKSISEGEKKSNDFFSPPNWIRPSSLSGIEQLPGATGFPHLVSVVYVVEGCRAAST